VVVVEVEVLLVELVVEENWAWLGLAQPSTEVNANANPTVHKEMNRLT
jgi:hypothetical protein